MSGATFDILTASGIVRSDIRSNFLTLNTTAPGVTMRVRLQPERHEFRAGADSAGLVFGDNSAAQIAAMTPAMTGNVTDGYVATAIIGIAT